MGAVFRCSIKKKKNEVPSKTQDTSRLSNDPSNKQLKEKKSKKNESKLKIIPIPESFNEVLTTNENKDNQKVKKPNIEEKFSNISSIEDVNPKEKVANVTTKKIMDTSIEKIDNDFVEENNEQMENNPNFFQVFIKDPEWANKNVAVKLNEFNWPKKGFVEIKALCFDIKYDYMLKGFKVLKSSENMNSSILSWLKVDEEDYYSFDLQDVNTYNLKTGQVTQNNKIKEGLKFGVDFHGSYLGLDLDNLNQKDIDPEIIAYLDMEIENLWNGLVGHWASIDFSKPTDILHGKNQYFGTDSVSVSKEISIDSNELTEFLITKFKDPDGFYSLMKSSNLIPNNLKKWNEIEITKEKFDIRLLNLYMIEKNSNFSGLIELKTSRPFIINIENTKKIVFEYNGDLFVDVSQSLKMMLVLWKDMPDTKKEEYILSEASNFQDLCMENLKQLLIELSEISTLPLNYRPKMVEEPKIMQEDEENEK